MLTWTQHLQQRGASSEKPETLKLVWVGRRRFGHRDPADAAKGPFEVRSTQSAGAKARRRTGLKRERSLSQ